MYFKRKYNVLFRDYESFGYITDNRNFEYKQEDSSENDIGDKILSESGSYFFSVLDKIPQKFDELVKKIYRHFSDVDFETVRGDAEAFYYSLEQSGFVVSGETFDECNKKEVRFSYKTLGSKAIKKDSYLTSCRIRKSSQDFLEKYYKGAPQLTSLHMEITSKCNERCVHCYIPHEDKLNNIEPDLFYDILKQCKDLKLLHLTLSGGEPMLHKHFCAFLEKCREYDFSVNVLSNLTLLNDNILKEMKKNPLLGVQVSLYSINPIIHDGITQMKGSFEKTRDAILKLIENDIPLQISCPIMKENKDCYTDVVKWAEKHKVKVGDDYVIIARYNHTTSNLNCRLSINEIKEMITAKVATDSKYLDQIEKDAEKKRNVTPDDFVCSVCNSSICVTDKGDVYPCAGWQDYRLGNLKKTLLCDIWNNSDKVNFLRNLRNRDFPKCIKCKDKEYCTMCMVRNANESPQGNPLDVNEYFCDIARLNKDLVTDRRKR